MPVLIYMESAYRRADGTGVIRCEAMLPGDGQATISKVVRDTTARQMTREKLLLLAELLQNGVPDSNGERRKLRHVEILVYTTDQAFWDDLRIQADAEMTNSPQQSRNSDVWYAAVWVLLILLIVGALTTILCGVLTPQGVLAWLGMEITKLVLVMRRYVDSLLDVFLKSLREYHIL